MPKTGETDILCFPYLALPFAINKGSPIGVSPDSHTVQGSVLEGRSQAQCSSFKRRSGKIKRDGMHVYLCVPTCISHPAVSVCVSLGFPAKLCPAVGWKEIPDL